MGDFITPAPTAIDVQALQDYFNFRPAPDAPSFWEICKESDISFDEVLQTIIKQEQWKADSQLEAGVAEKNNTPSPP